MNAEPPDILYPRPTTRVDIVRLKRTLLFAFAGGSADDALLRCLDEAVNPPSTWEPERFEEDLFIGTFLDELLKIRIQGHLFPVCRTHLRRLLTEPSKDPNTATFRQRVLQELTGHLEFRQELETVYVALCDLHTVLAESPNASRRRDIIQRRVDILLKTRKLIDAMASAFEGATSALSRIREYALRIQGTDGYERLCQLLQFEGQETTLDARLSIAFDGSLRRFEIIRVSSAKDSAYYASPMQRFLRKLAHFFRGFGFNDSEVLGRLVDEVFLPLEDEIPPLFQLMGDVEFYLAALGFKDVCDAASLPTCLPEFAVPVHGSEPHPRSLVDLHNPLLIGTGTPVPCQAAQSDHGETVLVTGPNSGGKTRLLQSVALTQLLGQAGFFVPAREAKLVWAEGMFLSLIDRPKPHQTEGHLGTELLRIRHVFENIRMGSVVILDELCSGTNPSEGEEICDLVLSLLQEVRAQAWVTTHFLKFAQRLQSEDRRKMTFLQVELDAGEGPTYQFIPGVARTSLARKTAERLGVTHEDLRLLIRRQLGRAASTDPRPAEEAPAEISPSAGQKKADPG